MSETLYNDNDEFVCRWLCNLIDAKHLPAGRVLCQDIQKLDASTLPETCHFFAGIGGWPLALKLAGWPECEPVWTGSCPCQPLSCAGKRKGHADERHLWPAFYSLIAERRPATVFGEQVAGKDGREWLAGIRADLEGIGYAVGSANLCAASVGSPQIRQRLYWVALSRANRLGESNGAGSQSREQTSATLGHGDSVEPTSRVVGVEHPDNTGWQGRNERRNSADQRSAGQAGLGFWSDFRVIPVGKEWKRIGSESGAFPLAHGVPARMVRLRGYGNAIVPQIAAEFVKAVMECL